MTSQHTNTDNNDTILTSPMTQEEEEEEPFNNNMMVTSSPDGAGVPTARFLSDERVYAKDELGGLYEAVIKKASFRNGNWTYLVHYQGWNSRWDKWMDEKEIIEDSKEARSLAEQQQLEQQRAMAAKREKRKRKKEDSSSSSSSSSKRRSGVDPQGLLALFQDACELPFTLKTILVEDQERIMNREMHDEVEEEKWRPARDVHHLPATVTINTVLRHYVKIKRKEAPEEKVQAAETKAKSFVNGLAELFEEALPKCLLYPPERSQHLAVQADPTLKDVRKVNLYGCEFLLRLYIRLPVLLAQAPPSDPKTTAKQLADLILLLQKNRQACFKQKYREPRQQELVDWEKALMDGTNICRQHGS